MLVNKARCRYKKSHIWLASHKFRTPVLDIFRMRLCKATSLNVSTRNCLAQRGPTTGPRAAEQFCTSLVDYRQRQPFF